MIQKVAVKVLLINDDDKVLLLRKSNDDARHAGNSGRYNLPGGKIDIGETLANALTREVYEETGLQVTCTDLQPFFAGEWRPVVHGEPLQIIGIFFICRDWKGELTLNDEHDACVWVNDETLSGYETLPPEDEALATYFASES